MAAESSNKEEIISWDDAFEEVARNKAQAGAAANPAAASGLPTGGAARPASLQPLQPEPRPEGGGKVDLDFILDIPLQVTVEIGRARLQINELLQLGQGSVIELTKLVGEPLDVLVNQRVVARGEIVVVNDRFGVRLTDIVSPMERVQQIA